MSFSPLLPIVCRIFAGLFGLGMAWGQDPILSTDRGLWTAGGPPPGAGIAVATDGDRQAVADMEGRVHLLEHSNGSLELRDVLFGPEGSAFGAALDWGPEHLAVGAPQGGVDRAGRVFLYGRVDGVWELQHSLHAQGAQSGDRFGASVLWQGDRLAVGAPGQGGGSVHLYQPQGAGWVTSQILTASDGLAGDGFGSAFAWEGARFVVGAPFASAAQPQQGAVYVFEDNGGTFVEEIKLLAVGPSAFDGFGTSVGTDGVFVAVGAPCANTGSTPAGRGFVFVEGIAGWSSIGVLSPTLGRPRDFFGSSLGMQPGWIVVGAPGDDTPQGSGSGSFSVFVEQNGLWSRVAQTTPLPAEVDAWSGAHVDATGASLLISAPGHGEGAGTVWAQAWRRRVDANRCGPAQVHSGAVSGRLWAYGSRALQAGPLALLAEDLPPSTFGAVLVSDGMDSLPGFQGGQGTLCLAQPFALFTDSIRQTGVAGSFQVEVHWESLPGFGMAQVGQTYHFQSWFRDRNPGPTTNMTDAVAILLQ